MVARPSEKRHNNIVKGIGANGRDALAVAGYGHCPQQSLFYVYVCVFLIERTTEALPRFLIDVKRKKGKCPSSFFIETEQKKPYN